MASTLSCLGLDVASRDEFNSLAVRAKARAVEIGTSGDFRVLRWEDPSGARLVFGVTSEGIVDFLPTFAGTTRTRLSGLTIVNEQVANAAVLDEDDEQLTAVSLEAEEARLIPPAGDGNYLASLVALGVGVTTLKDEDDFRNSEFAREMAPSSFFSGVGEDADDAYAYLSGFVLSATRRTTEETGQAFIAAVIKTVGFDITVCLEDQPSLPTPGSLICGTVFMTGSLYDFAGSS